MVLPDSIKKAFEERQGVSLEELAKDPDLAKQMIPSKPTHYQENSKPKYPTVNAEEKDKRNREILGYW